MDVEEPSTREPESSSRDSEDAGADHSRGLSLLTQAIQELSLARSLAEVQRIVRVAARALTGCDGSTFVFRDQGQCYYADEDAIAPLWKGSRFPMEACISGWVMLNREAAVIPDVFEDSRVPADAYRPTFVKSLVMVPVRRIDPIAAIGNYWAHQRQPSEQEVALLQALADSTSIALENVEMFAEFEMQVRDVVGEPQPPDPGTVGVPATIAGAGDAHDGVEDTFEAAFVNAPIGIALVGLDGRFERVNPALCRIVGYDAQELTKLTFQDITHPDDLDVDLDLATRVLSGEIPSYQMDKRYFTKDGHIVWIRLSGSLVRDANDQPVRFVSHIEDISARKRDEELLRRQATRDALTGVFSRSRFEEELARYTSLARRQNYEDEAAVFMIDLDGLKEINDRHGHAAGDEYLRKVAETIRRRLRLSDVLARIGGDEFAVLLPRTSPGQAQRLAQTLVEEVKSKVGGSVCIGVAVLGPGQLDDVLERADQAMYRAKRLGGGTSYGP